MAGTTPQNHPLQTTKITNHLLPNPMRKVRSQKHGVYMMTIMLSIRWMNHLLHHQMISNLEYLIRILNPNPILIETQEDIQINQEIIP